MDHLKQLERDFTSEAFGEWGYPSPDKGVLPYARGINYFTEGLSLEQLAAANMKEARAVSISESGRTLGKNGVHVGLLFWPNGRDKEDTNKGAVQAVFQEPVPLDEAISGDQPPITGRYPRVVLPAEGEFPYAVVMAYEGEEIFGTKFQTHTITVAPGALALGGLSDFGYGFGINIPDDVPCPRAVRAAIQEFSGSGFHIPSGTYTLKMELEMVPGVAVRIDGYRPLASKLMYDGPVRLELPIQNRIDPNLVRGEGVVEPVRRSRGQRKLRDEKYVELAMILPAQPDAFAAFLEVHLEYQGREDRADLTYAALRRHESVAETRQNPNLGLVEAQVSRFAKLLNVDISYEPDEAAKKGTHDKDLDSIRGVPGDALYDLSSKGIGGERGMLGASFGGGFRSPSVSTGKTVLRNAKTGKVSPKSDAEWDSHVHTLRFCLTNDIT